MTKTTRRTNRDIFILTEIPGFSGQVVCAAYGRFKLLKTDASEMTAAAPLIVERIDVAGEVDRG